MVLGLGFRAYRVYGYTGIGTDHGYLFRISLGYITAKKLLWVLGV